MSDDKHEHPGEDFVVLGPKTEDGRQTAIRHREDHTVELCEVYPVQDGRPISENSEIVQLSGEGPVYRVESSTRKGPAKVANRAFRENYDAIFGKKAASKDLN